MAFSTPPQATKAPRVQVDRDGDGEQRNDDAAWRAEGDQEHGGERRQDPEGQGGRLRQQDARRLHRQVGAAGDPQLRIGSRGLAGRIPHRPVDAALRVARVLHVDEAHDEGGDLPVRGHQASAVERVGEHGLAQGGAFALVCRGDVEGRDQDVAVRAADLLGGAQGEDAAHVGQVAQPLGDRRDPRQALVGEEVVGRQGDHDAAVVAEAAADTVVERALLVAVGQQALGRGLDAQLRLSGAHVHQRASRQRRRQQDGEQHERSPARHELGEHGRLVDLLALEGVHFEHPPLDLGPQLDLGHLEVGVALLQAVLHPDGQRDARPVRLVQLLRGRWSSPCAAARRSRRIPSSAGGSAPSPRGRRRARRPSPIRRWAP